MLGQLRKRFILITMLLVGIVLLMVSIINCVNVYQSQMSRIDRTLNAGMRIPLSGQFREGRFEDDENEFSDRFGSLTVLLDEDKDIITYDDTFIELDEGELEDVVDRVVRANTTTGKISSYHLFYKTSAFAGGYIISFADYKNAYKEISKSILFSFLLFVSAMLVFLLIAVWLSGYAMRPVKKAWDQQQRFVADASHELKTPLTAILANNNILLAHGDSTVDEQRKWIENSQAEAHHMKDLVNNMLFLAKSDGEEVKMLFSEVSLSDLATDISLQFEPVAFERGITIDTDDIDSDVTISGDMTQLRQLIHILIDNACKYADEGGAIKVSLKEPGAVIKLEVSNTGKPIPAEDLPHIFERFYRSDKARTQQNQAGGYGLGLAIASSIVGKHNGTISTASSVTDSTTFTVLFRTKK